MYTLVTGPSGVGKSTVLNRLPHLYFDADEYAMTRFGCGVIEASTKFAQNLEDEWERYAGAIAESGIKVISDCAVTKRERSRYLETFGPMHLLYFHASLPALLERNRGRGAARLPEQFVVEKYHVQELPSPEEGFVSIYLKSLEDGRVIAFGDEGTMASCGGRYDMIVSEAEWAAAGYSAHVNAGGDIVLGLSPDAEKRAWADAVRAERDIRLGWCDKISPMRWDDMTDEQRSAWREYRRALLRLPQTEGFPWDGENVPWPTKPE